MCRVGGSPPARIADVTIRHMFTSSPPGSTIGTMQLQSAMAHFRLVDAFLLVEGSETPVSTNAESISSPPPPTDEPVTRRDRAVAGVPVARLYMSGDLRAVTGISRTHLDFYLREGIVQPSARTESGYLLYDERELERLRRVMAWRQEGIGLREIRVRLERLRGESGV